MNNTKNNFMEVANVCYHLSIPVANDKTLLPQISSPEQYYYYEPVHPQTTPTVAWCTVVVPRLCLWQVSHPLYLAYLSHSCSWPNSKDRQRSSSSASAGLFIALLCHHHHRCTYSKQDTTHVQAQAINPSSKHSKQSTMFLSLHSQCCFK